MRAFFSLTLFSMRQHLQSYKYDNSKTHAVLKV